jgi:hypothetical protein
MTEGTTPGVLLKGADGSTYFIPHADLSQYATGDLPDEVNDRVASAPRLDALSVERQDTEGGTGAMIITPGG